MATQKTEDLQVPVNDGDEEQIDADQELVEMSSEVSALTDEQEAEEMARQETVRKVREEKTLRDKNSQDALNKLFLSSSKKRYLYLIRNTNVNDTIASLWDLLQKTVSAAAPYEDVRSFTRLCMRLLLPGFTDIVIEQIANDFIGSNKMRESAFFSQEEFFEMLLALSDLFIENLDVDLTTTFFEFLYNRLTEKVILKPDGSRIVQKQNTKVRFFNTNSCNVKFKEQFKGVKQPDNVIYCYEWLGEPVYNEITSHDTILTELRTYENILPIGVTADQVIITLQNQNLLTNTKDVESPQELSVLLTKAERLFYLGFVLQAKDSHLMRLTPALFAPYFFEELRDKNASRIFVNQRSIYGIDKDIDRVHEMTKRWKDKLVVPAPTAEELWDKSIEDAFHVLYLNKYRFSHIKDDPEDVKNLDFNTSDTFPTIHSEKFQNFKTRERGLPTDPLVPYEQDLIELSKDRPMHILVHGKPKIGKTLFCKRLAERLNLEIIDIPAFVSKFLKRIIKKEENQPEEQQNNDDDDGEKKVVVVELTWQQIVLKELREGRRIREDHLLKIIQEAIDKLRIDHKGCVLEVPCFDTAEGQMNFIELIKQGSLKLNSFNPVFNIIVELYVKDEKLLNRTRQLFENRIPENMIMKTKAELLTPQEKPKSDDDDDVADADDEDEAMAIKDVNLFSRINESDEIVWRGLKNYKENLRPKIEQLEHLNHHLNNIFVDYDTLTLDQSVDVVCGKLFPHSKFLQPVADKMEEKPDDEEEEEEEKPADEEEAKDENYASLLTEFKGDDTEDRPARSWSPFGIYDPVTLHNKKVLKGYSNFSCEYGGRIFCFNSRKNMDEFYRNPKPYLSEKPALPKEYNIAILGPQNAGKSQFAKRIAEQYGLEIIDLAALVQKKFEDQLKWETHVPNSLENDQVHFSKGEFNELKKGNPIDVAKALPFLLNEKGVRLQKRPPPPKDPELEEEERLRKEEEERLKAEASKKSKKMLPKKEEKKDDVKETVQVGEDLALSDLVPHVDYMNDVPGLKGFIFIDFPSKEEHLAILKEMKIELDRVIILNGPLTEDDLGDDNPGIPLSKRPDFFKNTTLDDERAYLTGNEKVPGLEALKTALGEDGFKDVDSNDVEQTYFKIRQYIDPFCIRVDDEAYITIEEPDLDPEAPKKPVFGEYGKYCPVTAIDDNWLVLGSPANYVQIRGKIYMFYGENEKIKFEANIEKYLSNVSPTPPPPRIFIAGCTGSGVKTHISHLQQKLKIPILKFKNEFEKLVEVGKRQRQFDRYITRKMKYPEDAAALAADPEDEDFAQDADDGEFLENEYKRVTDTLLKRLDAAIVNMRLAEPNEFRLPEDELEARKRQAAAQKEEEAESAEKEEILNYDSLTTMLKETKKVPELLIILKVSEAEMMKRCYNEAKIKAEYDRKMRDLNSKRRKALIEAVEEYQNELDTKRDEEGEDAAREFEENKPEFESEAFLEDLYAKKELPEAPKLDEMIANEVEKLKKLLEDETAMMDNLLESMKESCVRVEIFDANKSIDKVFKKIASIVSKSLEDRESLFERDCVFNVTETETLTTDKMIDLQLKSYLVKESRFGNCNAIQTNKAIISKKFPLLYRNRLYYAASLEEREMIKWNPKKYISDQPAAPKDIALRPKIVMLGRYKSGKTTVAKRACEQLGLVYISIPDVLELFAKHKYYGMGKDLFDQISRGQVPSDELVVDVLRLRLEFSDCVEHGFILENFPKTRAQALLMYKNRIVPDIVLSQTSSSFLIKKRAKNISVSEDAFEFDKEIIDTRLKTEAEELADVKNLFTYNFGNIRRLQQESIDARVEEVKLIVEEFIGGRQKAAVGINLKIPFAVTHLSIKKSTIMASIGPSLTFSPISLKKYGALEQMFMRSDPVLYYNENFFLLKDQEQVDSFVAAPQNFSQVVVPIERVARLPTLLESYEKSVEFRQYCPVELMHKRLVKGNRHLSLMAFNKLYCFSTVKAMRTFFKNPSAFLSVRLPDKIRVKMENKEHIAEIAAQTDLDTYIHNELSKLIVKALNQASKFRLKYPTISVHSTALKLVALCLKASNTQSSENQRLRYQKHMREFIADCLLAQQIRDENARRSKFGVI